ncbi:MAG: hypothetical protein IH987_07140, partial [Planctomycetes bacterium]|nr:hypothetical protein [Planctomycetota bacterium]
SAHDFNTVNCPVGGFVEPIHEYQHGGSPFRCSITGGEIYHGSEIPDLVGTYFFADWCSNSIWSFRVVGGVVTEFEERTAELAPSGGLTVANIASFGTDADGEMYICDHTGEVYKIIADVLEPPIRANPPHEILKNRYISIVPRGASGTNPDAHHIRVAVDSTQVPDLIGTGPWWAPAPVNGQPPSPATCISVVSAAKPAAEPDWSGCPVVHLTGCPIVPTTTYAIAVEADGNLSDEALLDTQAKPGAKWLGDIVGSFTGPLGNPPNVWTAPNLTTGADDFVAAIKTFQDPNALNATHLSRTDMEPLQNGTQINLLVNINDVFVIILGFKGEEYNQTQAILMSVYRTLKLRGLDQEDITL